MGFLTPMKVLFLCAIIFSTVSAASPKLKEVLGDLDLTEITEHQARLRVIYGTNLVEDGERMAAEDTENPPTVWWDAESGRWAVVMVDLDAPSRRSPTMREWRHWVVVNIPADELSEGDIWASYKGPTPPIGTGPHRHSFPLALPSRQYEMQELLGDLNLHAPATPMHMTIRYAAKEVHDGNEFTVSETARAPTVLWDAAPAQMYCLVMCDPDAPSRRTPRMREWRHWIVANLNGSDVSHGNVLTPYNGPTPPAGTGLHRYAFLLFKQNAPIPAAEITSGRALLLSYLSGCCGLTYVYTDITASQHWDAASGPFVLLSNIFVVQGVTLTIDPGVDVLLNFDLSLRVEGHQWRRVYCTTTSGCSFEHVCFADGGRNVNAVLRAEGTLGSFRNVTVLRSLSGGLYLTPRGAAPLLMGPLSVAQTARDPLVVILSAYQGVEVALDEYTVLGPALSLSGGQAGSEITLSRLTLTDTDGLSVSTQGRVVISNSTFTRVGLAGSRTLVAIPTGQGARVEGNVMRNIGGPVVMPACCTPDCAQLVGNQFLDSPNIYTTSAFIAGSCVLTHVVDNVFARLTVRVDNRYNTPKGFLVTRRYGDTSPGSGVPIWLSNNTLADLTLVNAFADGQSDSLLYVSTPGPVRCENNTILRPRVGTRYSTIVTLAGADSQSTFVGNLIDDVTLPSATLLSLGRHARIVGNRITNVRDTWGNRDTSTAVLRVQTHVDLLADNVLINITNPSAVLSVYSGAAPGTLIQNNTFAGMTFYDQIGTPFYFYASAASMNLTDNHWADIAYHDTLIQLGGPNRYRCLFANNTVTLAPGTSPDTSGCLITASSDFALHDNALPSLAGAGAAYGPYTLCAGSAFTCTFMDATRNWWGTADAAVIRAGVRDFFVSGQAAIEVRPYRVAAPTETEPLGPLSSAEGGGALTEATWIRAADGPVVVWADEHQPAGSVLVEAGTTLVLEAGATVRLAWRASVGVCGALVANGTAESRVTIGSQAGRWGSIFMRSPTQASLLRQADISGGGAVGMPMVANAVGVPLEVDGCTFADSGAGGLQWVVTSTANYTIRGMQASGCSSTGIYMDLTAWKGFRLEWHGGTFANNYLGLQLSPLPLFSEALVEGVTFLANRGDLTISSVSGRVINPQNRTVAVRDCVFRESRPWGSASSTSLAISGRMNSATIADNLFDHLRGAAASLPMCSYYATEQCLLVANNTFEHMDVQWTGPYYGTTFLSGSTGHFVNNTFREGSLRLGMSDSMLVSLSCGGLYNGCPTPARFENNTFQNLVLDNAGFVRIITNSAAQTIAGNQVVNLTLTGSVRPSAYPLFYHSNSNPACSNHTEACVLRANRVEGIISSVPLWCPTTDSGGTVRPNQAIYTTAGLVTGNVLKDVWYPSSQAGAALAILTQAALVEGNQVVNVTAPGAARLVALDRPGGGQVRANTVEGLVVGQLQADPATSGSSGPWELVGNRFVGIRYSNPVLLALGPGLFRNNTVVVGHLPQPGDNGTNCTNGAVATESPWVPPAGSCLVAATSRDFDVTWNRFGGLPEEDIGGPVGSSGGSGTASVRVLCLQVPLEAAGCEPVEGGWNWWGTDNLTLARARIGDFFSNHGLARVSFSPLFLSFDDAAAAAATQSGDDPTPSTTGATVSSGAYWPTPEESGLFLLNHTFAATPSPHLVNESTMVLPGSWVRIEPGAAVAFQGGVSVVVCGSWLARGTPNQPVVMSSAGSAAATATPTDGLLFIGNRSLLEVEQALVDGGPPLRGNVNVRPSGGEGGNGFVFRDLQPADVALLTNITTEASAGLAFSTPGRWNATVAGCQFESFSGMTSDLLSLRATDAPEVAIRDCLFTGPVAGHAFSLDGASTMEHLDIRRCRFFNTDVPGASASALDISGAIAAAARVQNCSFTDSRGIRYAPSAETTVPLVLRDTPFVNSTISYPFGDDNAFISSASLGGIDLGECTFRSLRMVGGDAAWVVAGLLSFNAPVNLTGCRFEDIAFLPAGPGTTAGYRAFLVRSTGARLSLTGCTFSGISAEPLMGLTLVTTAGSDLLFTNNTLGPIACGWAANQIVWGASPDSLIADNLIRDVTQPASGSFSGVLGGLGTISGNRIANITGGRGYVLRPGGGSPAVVDNWVTGVTGPGALTFTTSSPGLLAGNLFANVTTSSSNSPALLTLDGESGRITNNTFLNLRSVVLSFPISRQSPRGLVGGGGCRDGACPGSAVRLARRSAFWQIAGNVFADPGTQYEFRTGLLLDSYPDPVDLSANYLGPNGLFRATTALFDMRSDFTLGRLSVDAPLEDWPAGAPRPDWAMPPVITLQFARFADDYSALELAFDRPHPTNFLGQAEVYQTPTPCSGLFGAATAALVGSGATCQWMDPGMLNVILGSDADLTLSPALVALADGELRAAGAVTACPAPFACGTNADCSIHGVCVAAGTHRFCNCTYPWSGPRCAIPGQFQRAFHFLGVVEPVNFVSQALSSRACIVGRRAYFTIVCRNRYQQTDCVSTNVTLVLAGTDGAPIPPAAVGLQCALDHGAAVTRVRCTFSVPTNTSAQPFTYRPALDEMPLGSYAVRVLPEQPVWAYAQLEAAPEELVAGSAGQASLSCRDTYRNPTDCTVPPRVEWATLADSAGRSLLPGAAPAVGPCVVGAETPSRLLHCRLGAPTNSTAGPYGWSLRLGDANGTATLPCPAPLRVVPGRVYGPNSPLVEVPAVAVEAGRPYRVAIAGRDRYMNPIGCVPPNANSTFAVRWGTGLLPLAVTTNTTNATSNTATFVDDDGSLNLDGATAQALSAVVGVNGTLAGVRWSCSVGGVAADETAGLFVGEWVPIVTGRWVLAPQTIAGDEPQGVVQGAPLNVTVLPGGLDCNRSGPVWVSPGLAEAGAPFLVRVRAYDRFGNLLPCSPATAGARLGLLWREANASANATSTGGSGDAEFVPVPGRGPAAAPTVTWGCAADEGAEGDFEAMAVPTQAGHFAVGATCGCAVSVEDGEACWDLGLPVTVTVVPALHVAGAPTTVAWRPYAARVAGLDRFGNGVPCLEAAAAAAPVVELLWGSTGQSPPALEWHCTPGAGYEARWTPTQAEGPVAVDLLYGGRWRVPRGGLNLTVLPDVTPPAVAWVALRSSGPDPAWARPGDRVSLTFGATEALRGSPEAPLVRVGRPSDCGTGGCLINATAVAGPGAAWEGGRVWAAERPMGPAEAESLVPFGILGARDLAGLGLTGPLLSESFPQYADPPTQSQPATFTLPLLNATVTFDRTPPGVARVVFNCTRSGAEAEDGGAAVVAGQWMQVTFTTTEPVQLTGPGAPWATIAGQAAPVELLGSAEAGGGLVLRATRRLGGAEAVRLLQTGGAAGRLGFTIGGLVDRAGNPMAAPVTENGTTGPLWASGPPSCPLPPLVLRWSWTARIPGVRPAWSCARPVAGLAPHWAPLSVGLVGMAVFTLVAALSSSFIALSCPSSPSPPASPHWHPSRRAPWRVQGVEAKRQPMALQALQTVINPLAQAATTASASATPSPPPSGPPSPVLSKAPATAGGGKGKEKQTPPPTPRLGSPVRSPRRPNVPPPEVLFGAAWTPFAYRRRHQPGREAPSSATNLQEAPPQTSGSPPPSYTNKEALAALALADDSTGGSATPSPPPTPGSTRPTSSAASSARLLPPLVQRLSGSPTSASAAALGLDLAASPSPPVSPAPSALLALATWELRAGSDGDLGAGFPSGRNVPPLPPRIRPPRSPVLPSLIDALRLSPSGPLLGAAEAGVSGGTPTGCLEDYLLPAPPPGATIVGTLGRHISTGAPPGPPGPDGGTPPGSEDLAAAADTPPSSPGPLRFASPTPSTATAGTEWSRSSSFGGGGGRLDPGLGLGFGLAPPPLGSDVRAAVAGLLGMQPGSARRLPPGAPPRRPRPAAFRKATSARSSPQPPQSASAGPPFDGGLEEGEPPRCRTSPPIQMPPLSRGPSPSPSPPISPRTSESAPNAAAPMEGAPSSNGCLAVSLVPYMSTPPGPTA
ncbi:putative OV-16 antigen precursor [Paratrimastix pyriformis]|uniref:OV-16 antigen n=1 Tax=Paratrimastix pyriformis TaxID=342808 RepID=A0ABQ8UNK3_9EUKA|nr:putative OV-16 antigen precursor [Paratrimastix pyriformis]